MKGNGSAVKIVIWDLDNTLWDGVLLESETICLREQVVSIIKRLDERGIIHSIASRNNNDRAIAKLKEWKLFDYFVFPQINWGQKSDSIKDILETINLPDTSAAFIDDQPFERDEVAYYLPGIRCFELSDLDGLLALPEFTPDFSTEDSRNRRCLYQAEIKRKEAQEDLSDSDFLRHLNMEVTLEKAVVADLDRVAELTVRTHQLNTTGYTYSDKELRQFIDSESYDLLVISLKDKYGDYGKIGLLLLEIDTEAMTIKLFILSCRVLSRGIGNPLIIRMMQWARQKKLQLKAEFVATDVNRLMYVTYKFLGFLEQSNDNGKIILNRPLEKLPASSSHVSIFDRAFPVDTHSGLLETNTLLNRFSWVVDAFPDQIALQSEDESLRYDELDKRSTQLASLLLKKDIQTDSLVALFIPKEPLAIVGILGVLKAGAAYLPIDISYPSSRVKFILTDAKAKIILTIKALYEKLKFAKDLDPSIVILCLDNDMLLEEEKSEVQCKRLDNSSLAYVMYTSGSAGFPKGVQVEHKHLLDFISSQMDFLKIDQAQKVLSFASLAFDTSVLDIFISLLTGSMLYFPKCSDRLSPNDLFSILSSKEITLAILPPVVLNNLPSAGLPHLMTLLAGGDVLTEKTISRWMKGRRFFNPYGPTEATVCCFMEECRDPSLPNIIGRPLPGRRAYILDDNQCEVSSGKEGELYIGGNSIARGYLNQPLLTKKHFVIDPLRKDPDVVFYKTGDLVRQLPDGRFEFIGRKDSQIKIRGKRVEPAEVRFYLEKHPSVNQAEILVKDRNTDNPKLYAYFSCLEDVVSKNKMDFHTLNNFLRGGLPDYMIPSDFFLIDSFPVNENGKVDYKRLAKDFTVGLKSEILSQGAVPDKIEAIALAVWVRFLEVEALTIHANVFDFGANSLMLARVSDALTKALDLSVRPVDLIIYPTVERLVRYLKDTHKMKQQKDACEHSEP